jgi:hypothetical protein
VSLVWAGNTASFSLSLSLPPSLEQDPNYRSSTAKGLKMKHDRVLMS